MVDDQRLHDPDDVLRRMLGATASGNNKASADDVLNLLNRINSPTSFAERDKLIAEFKSVLEADLFKDEAARNFAKSVAKAFFQE